MITYLLKIGLVLCTFDQRVTFKFEVLVQKQIMYGVLLLDKTKNALYS